MKELPIEPEDVNNRLYGNREYKERNREFGSIEDLNKSYPTDESILDKIYKIRALKTLGGCPECGSPFQTFKKVPTKLAYRCRCGYKIHPLKGTHLEHCRTNLKTILIMIYELFCSKNGTPATWIQRRTGKYYEACWANLHKISDFMHYYSNSQKFTPGSSLQLDVVYPICKTYRGKHARNKKGLGSERTFGVLMISEVDEPENDFMGITKGFYFDKTKSHEIKNFVKEHIKVENKHNLSTDGGSEFEFLNFSGYNVHSVNHSNDEFKGKYTSTYIDNDTGKTLICTTNLVEGGNRAIKTTIHRIYRTINPDYLQLYIERLVFNQTNKTRNFFEALDQLFGCLPGFNDSVNKTFSLKKRNRQVRGTAFKDAA